MGIVTRDDIEAAADRLADRIRVTPVVEPGPGAFGLPNPVTLKLELLQHTGSFKPRGAFNRVLTADVPDAGLIAASGGNHGAAVAYVARALGLPVEIFVPEATSAVKVARLHHLGVTPTVAGAVYDDAQEAAGKRAEETGALIVHPYDHPAVVAGQGTVGRELDAAAPGLDTVLVAVGGGGLIAGIASWFRTDVRIVAVEPENCPSLSQALAAGEPVDAPVSGVAADSLGARRVGDVTFAVARDFVDQSVLVPDEAIVEAQRLLWSDARLAAEAGGAAALAALISGGYSPSAGERVAVVVCGGNLDPASLH